MLEGMNNIDWEKLQAPQIPSLFRQMASEDEKERGKAHAEFNEQILHSRAIFDEFELNEAELFRNNIQLIVLPFLIELISNEKVPGKSEVLHTLYTMTEYIYNVEPSSVYYPKAEEIRHAVWEHYAIYVGCLESEIRETKLAAIQLLAQFREHSSQILPHFHILIEATQENKLKSIILWEINHNLLNDGKVAVSLSPQFVSYLETLVESNSEHIVRITSAIILINTFGENAPHVAITYLSDTLVFMSDKPPFDYNIPTVSASMQAKVLPRLGVQRGLPVAIQVIDKSELIENRFHALVPALILVFSLEQNPYEYIIIPSYRGDELANFTLSLLDGYEIQPFNPDSLNASQETVIEAIVRNDWIWEINSNIFEVFHLPKSRMELARLL